MLWLLCFVFFNDPATTDLYTYLHTLSLHDALPLYVMHFWFEMGVDGLRLDAVPYLVEREGTNNENLAETHAILKTFRAELEARYPDRMLLAEEIGRAHV